MFNRDVLTRIDRKLDRIDETLDRNAAAFERMEAAYERMETSYERWAAREGDHREFIREMTARMQRAAEIQEAGLRRFGERIDAGTRRLDDLTDENRAQRSALLAVLDRLGPGPGPATA